MSGVWATGTGVVIKRTGAVLYWVPAMYGNCRMNIISYA